MTIIAEFTLYVGLVSVIVWIFIQKRWKSGFWYRGRTLGSQLWSKPTAKSISVSNNSDRNMKSSYTLSP